MEIIKDGKGRGYTVEVNEHNQIKAYSTVQSNLAYVSENHQTAFMVYGKRDFVAANTDEAILFMTYTGSNSLVADRITLTTNSSLAKVEMYVDSTRNSGGTLRVPLNLNRGSGITSETTVYVGISGSGGELDITCNDDNEVFDLRLTSSGLPTYTFDFSGGLILEKNNTICLVGEVDSIGDKIRANVYYYEEPS